MGKKRGKEARPASFRVGLESAHITSSYSHERGFAHGTDLRVEGRVTIRSVCHREQRILDEEPGLRIDIAIKLREEFLLCCYCLCSGESKAQNWINCHFRVTAYVLIIDSCEVLICLLSVYWAFFVAQLKNPPLLSQ